MKFRYSSGHGEKLVRVMSSYWIELAYFVIGIQGLQFMISFPSDWHEQRRGWIRIGLGFIKICVSFPWKWVVPDEGQCAGPEYGFQFSGDLLWIRYGKDKGRRTDPHKAIYMPWAWDHKEHTIHSAREEHPYRYVLKSGEVQERVATIRVESRRWERYWYPRKLVKKTIDVQFNDEVGERSGSWKGGTIGCSYDMLPGETALQTLRRMEAERKL